MDSKQRHYEFHPKDKNLTLRDYQKIGIDFLVQNNSCFLADDMGLGKTIQVIGAITVMIQEGHISRALIVVPSSLITNWLNELEKWSTINSWSSIKGSAKTRQSMYLTQRRISVISYDSLVNDTSYITESIFKTDLIVLDEAQRIKNRNTLVYKGISKIKNFYKSNIWMLTGTPVQNSADELKSFSMIIDPYGAPSVSDKVRDLTNFLEGKILRRLKADVLKDLPEKIEQTIYLDFNQAQSEEYDSYIKHYRKLPRNDLEKNFFSYLNKLKHLCNFGEGTHDSAKLDYVMDILNNINQSNNRLIVFSQYVDTLNKIKNELTDHGYEIYMYHGSMSQKEKDTVLADFKKSDVFCILLISLKAGGVGLNLQEATHLILYDRWWNPALESQAIARAYRFGRNKNLHVIKFIMKSSIEEDIERIIDEKKLLIDFVEGETLKQSIKIKDFFIKLLGGKNV